MKKSIVILSGGLDSTTCLAIALDRAEDVYPLTFTYGQRHSVELDHARAVVNYYGLGDKHRLINLAGIFHGSSLTDKDLVVPLGRSDKEIQEGVPNTYVPARNTVFLAIALAQAEAKGAGTIYIGVNALDYSGYPDCRPEFIAAFQQVIDKGTVAGSAVRIATPLVNLDKAEIVRLAMDLKAPIHLTYSCYMGNENPCGQCDACQLRQKGFTQAGLADPANNRLS